jgi:predicted phage terminase large subunit-like protein
MHGNLTHSDLVRLYGAKKRLKEIEQGKVYEGSLYEFLSAGWQHIDPAEFVGSWHLQAIAEHLEAVNLGHIKRLLINIPPRMSKSSIVSVAWPAWTWLQKPESYLEGPQVQFLYASYAESLAVRDSIKTRRLIESPWYQKYWGNRFHLVDDQNTKIKFENDFKGYRFCTSVGGTVTGEGGAILCIDDAHKADEVESDVTRNSVLDWYDEVFSTRLNDPRQGAIVVIGQRVHEGDISGHLLETGEFTHLMIPMEYEAERHCVTVLGLDEDNQEVTWEEPRTVEGQMLCEGRYDAKALAEHKKKPFVWAGQFQQRPAPKGGSIIKRDYWRVWDRPKYPPFEYLLASLDTAYTENHENDPCALTIWGQFRDEANNPRIMLVWSWRDWLEFPELCQKVIDICTVDNRLGIDHPRFPVDRIIVEAKATGLSLVQELYRALKWRVPVEAVNYAKGKHTPDKTARLYSVQYLFADGMIWAPANRQFIENVIRECEIFPKGQHDDLVDTVSLALRYLRDAGFALTREEYSHEVVEDLTFRPQQGALYPV